MPAQDAGGQGPRHARGDRSAFWERSHELLRLHARFRRDGRGLAPRLGQACGVPAHAARQRLCRRPRRRAGCGLADGIRLCRAARSVALGVQASVLGAQVRLGKVRRDLFDAFWLGKRVRSRSLADGLDQVREQSVAEEHAGAARSRAAISPRPTRCRPADDAPSSRGGEGRMEGASRAENLAEVDFRKLARSRAGGAGA